MDRTLSPRVARIAAIAVAAAGLATLVAAPTRAAAKQPWHRKGVLVGMSSEIVVKAEPDAVWQTLTRDRGLLTIAGFSPSSMGPSRRVMKVGDFFPASTGEDGGMLVVTLFDADTRELRASFEPQSGQSLCHVTVRVEPVGAGSRVTVIHRYTDDRPAAAVDKTAREATADMARQLAAFKTLAETTRDERR